LYHKEGGPMKAAAFLLALTISFLVSRQTLAFNPPSPYQKNPDIYAVSGFPSVFAGWTQGDLSTINPITNRLRAGARSVTYSYLVVPGCSAGNMEFTLRESLADASEVLGITFVPVSSGADIAVRATCGVDASNVGLTGGAVCDLYPSWPYKSQVNCSTTMATFYDLSQKTIWSHEIIGHGLGSWHEQYVLGGSFAPTAGLVDWMNTGDLSRREAWPQNDKDRWERTVYPLTADCQALGFDPCSGRWRQESGFSWDPATGFWWNPSEQPEWTNCNPDGLRWNIQLQVWMPAEQGFFSPGRGYWSFAPGC
jgi:hypothetical protein